MVFRYTCFPMLWNMQSAIYPKPIQKHKQTLFLLGIHAFISAAHIWEKKVYDIEFRLLTCTALDVAIEIGNRSNRIWWLGATGWSIKWKRKKKLVKTRFDSHITVWILVENCSEKNSPTDEIARRAPTQHFAALVRHGLGRPVPYHFNHKWKFPAIFVAFTSQKIEIYANLKAI